MAITWTVLAGATSYEFEATEAEGEAGLLRDDLEADDGTPYAGGWVRLADGSVRGDVISVDDDFLAPVRAPPAPAAPPRGWSCPPRGRPPLPWPRWRHTLFSLVCASFPLAEEPGEFPGHPAGGGPVRMRVAPRNTQYAGG